ncbi:MAG: hypothetical protein LBF57_00670 [Holosporaceae bacterium]|jgi:hypothetical protein|nr:hypothetical protein [Holosporaceae bacterium]
MLILIFLLLSSSFSAEAIEERVGGVNEVKKNCDRLIIELAKKVDESLGRNPENKKPLDDIIEVIYLLEEIKNIIRRCK